MQLSLVFFGLTVACLVFAITNMVVYYSKRHTDITREGRIFVVMMLANIVGILLEVGCYFVVAFKLIPEDGFVGLAILKSFVAYLIFYVLCLNLYAFSIFYHSKSAFKKLIVLTVLFGIAAALLTYIAPIYVSTVDGLSYTYGLATDDLLIPATGVAMFVWSVLYVKRRHKMRDRRLMFPIVLFVLINIANVIIQGFINRGILLAVLTETLTVIIMMNTVENPELKLAQVLERANKKITSLAVAKDEFMSIASHQLRTPLTSINGYTAMLLDDDFGKLNEGQRKIIAQLNNTAANMSGVVNDFLNVSRLQSGKFTLEKTDVNLHKLLDMEVDQLNGMAEEKGVKLKLEIGKRLPASLSLDADKIGQVMMNLIDNAIHYTPKGKQIRVVLAMQDGQVHFMVIDQGIGVPKSEQSKLFGKFFRASNARTTRPNGTGVGLFLAKKVVTAHGGKLIFASQEGKGSTFGFMLPIPEAASKAKTAHHAAERERTLKRLEQGLPVWLRGLDR